MIATIDRNRMYSTEACMKELGIGRKLLWQARQTKIVTAYPVGHSHWYDGAELIEWIKSQSNGSGTGGDREIVQTGISRCELAD